MAQKNHQVSFIYSFDPIFFLNQMFKKLSRQQQYFVMKAPKDYFPFYWYSNQFPSFVQTFLFHEVETRFSLVCHDANFKCTLYLHVFSLRLYQVKAIQSDYGWLSACISLDQLS